LIGVDTDKKAIPLMGLKLEAEREPEVEPGRARIE